MVERCRPGCITFSRRRRLSKRLPSCPTSHNLAVITTSPPGASGEEIGPPGLSPQEAAANWQLVDEVNVKLVPPDDPLELARAIVTLGHDPEKRHTLGKGGRLLVERCQWSTIAADLLDFCAIMKANQALLKDVQG